MSTRSGTVQIGTRATGRSRTYRYYTCHTRNRYDSNACDAPRLDADAVDTAVLHALATCYRTQHALIADAVEQTRHHQRAAYHDRRTELDTVTTQLTQTRQAIDRYLIMFEHGAIDEALVAKRLRALQDTSRALTARRDELTATLGDAPAAPDSATLDQIADHLDKVIATGTPNQRKALVEALVARVTINGPNRLIPVFRIPNHGHETGAAPALPTGTAPDQTVRALTTLVGPRGIEPRTRGLKVRCSAD